MTSEAARALGKRSDELERERLGNEEYRRRRSERGKRGGAAGAGVKKPRKNPKPTSK